MLYSKIVGLGHHVPERVITNEYLSSIMDTNDAWIVERTGIKERRWMDPAKDTVANMAAKATRMALQNARLTEKDIDFIVFATITPDYFFPGSGVLLQRELGLDGRIAALDVRNACSGFIYALSVADQFIKTGMYKTILVIGAEIQSTALDLSTDGRNTAVIFGDGAGAVILQSSEKPGILSTHLHSDGRFAEELYVKDPGSSRPQAERQPKQILDTTTYKVVMNGNQVFKHAVVRFMEVINEALTANRLKKEDIDLLVPHQANLRINQMVAQLIGLPPEKMHNNIQKYGNTTAATIPICMYEAIELGKIVPGSLVCLVAFGAGLTWGSAFLRY